MSGGGEGIIYGLEFQCRALDAIHASCEDTAAEDTTGFIVGTQSLSSGTNQVHVVRVLDNEDAAICESAAISKTVYSHPIGEIWQIAQSPKDPNLFVSRHSSIDNGACRTEATLWSRKDPDRQAEDEQLDTGCIQDLYALCSLTGSQLKGKSGDFADVSHVDWVPSGGDSSKVMVLSENQLALHDVSVVEEGKSKILATGHLEGKGYTNFYTGSWNPHQNCQQYCTINEHTVRGWDIRSMKQAWMFDSHSGGIIRSVDFNPNKQYHLATAGDDGCARFWDIRASAKPLAVRCDHSHWIWSLKFNQFHDQLVLSSSSDCHVVLSCLASISSEPHGHIVDDEDEETPSSPPLADGVLKTFEDHEESVYSAAWSSVDPWTFASLSYDGRLVINRVPRAVKFKILNLV